MKLKDIQAIYRDELKAIYPREEINNIFYLLLEHDLGLDRFILAMQPEYRLTKEEEQPLFTALSSLKTDYPIQYILGKAHFMDLEFLLNESVLIPRPETEDLVRWVLEDRPLVTDSPQLLDIGTGCGCIAISLARNWPHARVTALDLSDGALDVAGKNAGRLGVEINLVKADILRPFETDRQWDIIVSNPPYVREADKLYMHNNVKGHEPAMALFVPDENPLLFYEHIADFARKQLCKEGLLYLEINQYLGQEMVQMLSDRNFSDIRLRKDLFGNDRMIRAKRP